jgi:hypothetical protein
MAISRDMQSLIDVVETWNTQKEAGRQFTQKESPMGDMYDG